MPELKCTKPLNSIHAKTQLPLVLWVYSILASVCYGFWDLLNLLAMENSLVVFHGKSIKAQGQREGHSYDDQTGWRKGRKEVLCVFLPSWLKPRVKKNKMNEVTHTVSHVVDAFACLAVLKQAVGCHQSGWLWEEEMVDTFLLLCQLRKWTHSASWNNYEKNTVPMVTSVWTANFYCLKHFIFSVLWFVRLLSALKVSIQ